MRLDRLRWTEVSERAGASLLAVPIGSTEQHGPHLPLSTDTDVAVELCDRLAELRGDVLVAPAVAFGSAGEHAAFPGTLSVGAEVTEQILVELGRSADAFAGVLFVSTHGGNAGPVRSAVRLLASESRRVRAWSPGAPGCSSRTAARGKPGSARSDAHAGFTETSVMLALKPDRVDVASAARGRVEPIETLMPALRAKGLASVSPSGVLGDPTGASAASGEEILAVWLAELLASVEVWP